MKKLLAALLTMAMLLTAVPLSVSAEGSSVAGENYEQDKESESNEEGNEEPEKEPEKDPTKAPTEKPTEEPTEATTAEPTKAPTEAPDREEETQSPTAEPSVAPSPEPTEESPAEGAVVCEATIEEKDFTTGELKVDYKVTIDGKKVETEDVTYEWKIEGENEVLSYTKTYTCSVDDVNKTLVCTVTDPKYGTAVAKAKVYQITASVNDGKMGSISPSGEIYAIEGSKPEFKIEWTEGYSISKYVVDKEDQTPQLSEDEAKNRKTTFKLPDSVKQNHNIKVYFEAATYTVKWVNCDEKKTVLETDENVEYGTTPEYNGGDCGKPVYPGVKDDGYVYVFDDWDPEVVPASGDPTEHIVYTAAYKKYKTSKKYNLLAVHYMAYSGDGKVEELTNAFYYTVKKEGDVVESAKYKKSFKNYSYVGASMPSMVIAADKNDPLKLEHNCIYLYYMKNDAVYQGKAQLDADGSVLVGTDLCCEYTPKNDEDKGTVYYIWYTIESDGKLEKQGKKSQNAEHATDASEAGKWMLCEVTDSGNSRGAFSNAVFVRGEDSTLTIEESDLAEGRVTAVYTPAEDTVTGELTYRWERRENADEAEGEVIGTSAGYTLKAEDVGKIIYCKVTDEDGTSGSAEASAGVFTIETSVSDANRGTIKPDGTLYVVEGSQPVFTITSNGDYYASDILIDDQSAEVESKDSYTFEPINASHTIHVTYGPVVITWKNSDGTILATDNYDPKTDAEVTPEYKGSTPVYPSTIPEGKIYYPSSWKPEIKTVSETGDTAYTAGYLSYSTSKYALFAVHYMMYDGNGNAEENEDSFIYEIKELGETVKAEDYESDFEGYTCVGASVSSLTIETDNHLVSGLEKNIIYLYYMPEETAYTGTAKLNVSGEILWSTELTCEYSASDGTENYTWYSIEADGTLKKLTNGSTYTTRETDRGKRILCEVKGSEKGKGALSETVCVKKDSSTVSVSENDFASGKLTALYTPLEGTTAGELSYEWVRRDDDGKEESVGNAADYTLTESDAEKTLICKVKDTTGDSGSAEKAVKVFTINASVDDVTKGSINPSGIVYAIEGSEPCFTVTPADGYRVEKYLMDDADAEGDTKYTFSALAASHTLVAVLTVNVLTVEWVNYNCSTKNPIKETIRVETGLVPGTVPEYKGAKPVYTKETEVPSDYIYVFNGWDPALTEIYDDTTYLTKYVRYPSETYALLAVHYMVWNENGKYTEMEDEFTYDPYKIDQNIASSRYVKTIEGYVYNKASVTNITIQSDANRVENLKNNILYLYYIPGDGVAKLNTNETAVLSGTELVCEFIGGASDITYTWYTVDDDGIRTEVGTGDSYTTSDSEMGKYVYCVVTENGETAICNTNTVKIANGTVTVVQEDTKAKTVKATYTPATGTTAGTLIYTWYRCTDASSGSTEEQIGTGPSYTLQAGDVGKLIFCSVTDTGESGGGKSAYKRVWGITTSLTGNGTINPADKDYYVLEGGTLKFTFTPKSALYKISALKIDGDSIDVASSYTFSNIQKSYKLRVEFAYISSSGTATAGDGSEEEPGDEDTTAGSTENGVLYPDETMQDIPEEYAEPAQNPGSVEKVSYTTEDGASHYALVYVPAGYDENAKYNILYLLHGENDTPESILGTEEAPSILKNTLDHMIEAGLIEPMLVAAPSLYPDDYDPELVTVEELVEAFSNDWSVSVIPAIETKYSTYAGKDAEEESLVASRDHRAFGGYGAGAAATWYAFMNDLRYTSTFVPVSEDCWLLGRNDELNVQVETAAEASDTTAVTEDIDDETVSDDTTSADTTLSDIPAVRMSNYSEEVQERYSTLANALSTSLFNTDYWTEDFFIYAMSGTLDEAGARETALIAAMREMAETPFYFSNERAYGNVSYRVKEGAAYDATLLGMYLYNTLQDMWPIVTEETIDESADTDDETADDGSFEDSEEDYDEETEYPEDAEPVEDIAGMLDNLPKI